MSAQQKMELRSPREAGSARKTFTIWVVLLLFFGALWANPRAVLGPGVGFVVGLVASFALMLLVARVRGAEKEFSRNGKNLCAAAVAVALGAVCWHWPGRDVAIAVVVGSAGVFYGWAALDEFRFRRHRRIVRDLDAALTSGAPIEARLETIATWTTTSIFEAVETLVDHRRHAQAEALLLSVPREYETLFGRAIWLVDLRLRRGNLDGARDIVDELGDLRGRLIELPKLLTARIRIATGEAHAVAADLAVEQPSQALRGMRALIRADALAECGDREHARRLVQEVANKAQAHERFLERLTASNRPIAPIAAELMRGDAQPFR